MHQGRQYQRLHQAALPARSEASPHAVLLLILLLLVLAAAAAS